MEETLPEDSLRFTASQKPHQVSHCTTKIKCIYVAFLESCLIPYFLVFFMLTSFPKDGGDSILTSMPLLGLNQRTNKRAREKQRRNARGVFRTSEGEIISWNMTNAQPMAAHANTEGFHGCPQSSLPSVLPGSLHPSTCAFLSSHISPALCNMSNG